LRKKVGDAVAACEPWVELHAADDAILASVIPSLEAALRVDSSIPEPRTCIHMRMG
jgi:thymidine phosphorylase